jgi:hypothetical protein
MPCLFARRHGVPPSLCVQIFSAFVATSSVSALTYLPAQGVIVGSQYSPPRLVVYNASTGDLTNTLGSSGTGTTVGATVQFGRPRWTAAVPWSSTAVLVPDDVNDRVVEVDTVTGLLVKVWLSGVTNPFGVAATGSRIAVGWGAETLTTSKLDMYDLAGTLQWSVGGVYVGDSSSAGTLLGDPAHCDPRHGTCCNQCSDFDRAGGLVHYRCGMLC